MNNERTKNSSRVFMFGFCYNLLTTLFPFCIRTIIVYNLGIDYVGLSGLFTSLLSMLNMSELGIGSAITFCMYKPVAESDNKTICSLLNLMKKLYNYIGIFIFVIGLSILPFLNMFIKSGYPNEINIYLLYIIYLINTGISYVLFSYKSTLFEVHQRGDVIHKTRTVVELLKYILQIVILIFFKNYYIFALMLPVSQIVTNIYINYKSKVIYPDLIPEGDLSNEIKKVIKKKVLFLSIHSITSTFTNSIDNIVISSYIGITAIAYYGNYSYITSAILAIVMIAYRAIKSAVGNALYTKTKEDNRYLFEGLSFTCWWGTTVLTICLMCVFQPFMELWLGKKYILDNMTVIFICLYFYINSSRQFLTSIYISSAGLWNKTLFRQILVTIANLLLDLLLVRKLGLLGIILSSFLTHFAIGFPLDISVVYENVLYDSRKYVGISKEVSKFVIMMIALLISFAVCNSIKINIYINIICYILISFVIPSIIILLFYRNKTEYIFLKEHLIMIVNMLKRR